MDHLKKKTSGYIKQPKTEKRQVTMKFDFFWILYSPLSNYISKRVVFLAIYHVFWT